jgi:hypothetical protein
LQLRHTPQVLCHVWHITVKWSQMWKWCSSLWDHMVRRRIRGQLVPLATFP